MGKTPVTLGVRAAFIAADVAGTLSEVSHTNAHKDATKDVLKNKGLALELQSENDRKIEKCCE